jgi:type II secretory pathway component GspD/PulD (secretin)
MASASSCRCRPPVAGWVGWAAGFALVIAIGVVALPGRAHGRNGMPPEGFSTGQTISLDLKGVDILDVLKLLSQRSGLNFVAGRNVSGRVTIFAKDVDVWQAFERIVEANELAYERQNDLINVMTAMDYELLYGEKFNERRRNLVMSLRFAKANQLATVLSQLKSSLGQVMVDEASNSIVLNDVPGRLEEMKRLVTQLDRPTETRIYSMRYAEVDKLREKLQEFLTPGVGTLSFDLRTNKVVITDLSDVLPKLERIILAFDDQSGEVLIDSKLVKVELTDNESFGVDWQQVFAGVDTKARGNFRVLSDIVDGTASGAAVKFVSAPEGNTQIILEALKTYGKVETVSNPRIAVSSGQEAKILVGTKEAFVTVTTTVPTTGSVVTSPEIQFVDVGTKLFVTPHVKPDGHVQMKIRPEVSTARVEVFQNNRIPIVSTTEAETNVLVKSGSTLIIGGLIDSKVERTQNQLPVLGDLPILGSVFRSRVDTGRKSELVVFLTPQIITTSGERLTTFTSDPIIEQIDGRTMWSGEPVPKSYQQTLRYLLEQRLRELFKSTTVAVGNIDISFVLSSDGKVVGRPQISSNQGGTFEELARAAIESIPFPPFPTGSQAHEVQFRFRVDYKQE